MARKQAGMEAGNRFSEQAGEFGKALTVAVDHSLTQRYFYKGRQNRL